MIASLPYSPATRAGDFVFVAGQIGLDGDGQLADSFETQCRQAIANLRSVLETEGLNLGNVVKTSVYFTDSSDFPTLNDIYGEVMEAPYPARAAMQVAWLPRNALVEIEAIAHVG